MTTFHDYHERARFCDRSDGVSPDFRLNNNTARIYSALEGGADHFVARVVLNTTNGVRYLTTVLPSNVVRLIVPVDDLVNIDVQLIVSIVRRVKTLDLNLLIVRFQ